MIRLGSFRGAAKKIMYYHNINVVLLNRYFIVLYFQVFYTGHNGSELLCPVLYITLFKNLDKVKQASKRLTKEIKRQENYEDKSKDLEMFSLWK